jgi:hypothetical protein
MRADDLLLLEAAVLPPELAVPAWEKLRTGGGPRSAVPAAQRLLPQLYGNLLDAGVDDAGLAVPRVAYRKTWARNRILLRELATILDAFRDAGIDTLVLKGAALIALAYGDHGRRPTTDVDVLVPHDLAVAAMRLLESRGWRSSLGSPEALVEVRHADEFVDARGRRLDLHWSVLKETCGKSANDDFWLASIPLELDGAPTRALCPADQLLHVCVHGSQSGPVQPLGWIADSVVLLRAQGDALDWERLLEQARRRRLIVPLREALGTLDVVWAGAVPHDVLDALAREQTTRFDRLEHRIKRRRRPLLGSLPVLWFDYRRLARGQGAPPGGFPSYLQRTFRVRTLRLLPVTIVVLAVRRIVALVRTPTQLAGS